MIHNQINQIFALLTKQNATDSSHLRQIFQKICPSQEIPRKENQIVTKNTIINLYNQAVEENLIQERLFHIFYSLDQTKKGYLSPQDMRRLFKIFGKEVSLTEVQNSFRYAKLAQNRMSFQDFKEHFYKF